jgi:hypothetical protein
VAGVEPTPIFAALAGADPGDDAGARRRGAHDDGRPVTELLRALREDDRDGAPGSTTRRVGAGRRRVGHVPDLLSF